MITYNGGSVSNLINNLGEATIYVTDMYQRAVRYANAQATGTVNTNMHQELAENAVVLEIEANPKWLRRDENHSSLDVCEACVSDYRIIKAAIRFGQRNTLYGRRGNYKDREQIVNLLLARNIIVEVI